MKTYEEAVTSVKGSGEKAERENQIDDMLQRSAGLIDEMKDSETTDALVLSIMNVGFKQNRHPYVMIASALMLGVLIGIEMEKVDEPVAS